MLQQSLPLTLLLTVCLLGGLAVSTVTASSLPVPAESRGPLCCAVQMNRLMAAAWIAAGFLTIGPLAGGTLLLIALGIAMNRAATDPIAVTAQGPGRQEALAGASLAANASLTLGLTLACVAGLAA